VNAVARTGSRLVAVGTAGSQAVIWTSSDGSQWQRVSTELDGAGELHAVAARGSIVIALGYNDAEFLCGQKKTAVFGSTDGGATWRALDGPDSGSQWHDVVPFGGGFVALGYAQPDCNVARVAAAWASADGTAWKKSPLPEPVGNELLAGGSVGGVLFAGGDGPTRLDTESKAKDQRDAEIWAGTVAGSGATVAR
jgi:hypothetical protein